MSDVSVQLGFYVERPYGNAFSEEEKGRIRKKGFEAIKRINNLCNKHNISRTFFILGDYLEQAYRTLGELKGEGILREIFETDNTMVDIGQHAYSHRPFLEIPTRPDKESLTPSEIDLELRNTSNLIFYILGREAIGLGTPCGYSGGLKHISDEAQMAIYINGIKYISSDLRDSKHGLNPPLFEDGQIRQPYPLWGKGIIEIPSHGWQDNVFTGTSSTKGVKGYPKTVEDIAEHYIGLIKEGIEASKENKETDEKGGKNGKKIYLSFCMHPWAIVEYDLNLDVLESIVSFSLDNGVKVQGYKQAFMGMRESLAKKDR
ncbi:polysaccharide deacetylase family protein [candidate division KSB1 bacterium]